MTQNYFHVAIHEAGHAVAYLAEGISVDSIILDCDAHRGRVIPSEGPKSVKSDAVITLAGIMAEHVAHENGAIDVSPTPLPDFNRVPLMDDEIKYWPCVDMLAQAKPILTRTNIDLDLKRETRDLIERHWKAILKIAESACSAPERRNQFLGENQKYLDGTIIEKIFKQSLVELP